MKRPQLSLRVEVEPHSESCSKILPHLYLGSKDIATDKAALRSMGITHIVNCTSSKNLFPTSFTYLSLNIRDSVDQGAALRACFEDSFKMIDEARRRGTKCLVHCSAGMSRSSSIVLAYLMRRQEMTLLEALEFARRRRPQVSPNAGFMETLCHFEMKQFPGQHSSLSLETYRDDRFASQEELACTSDSEPSPVVSCRFRSRQRSGFFDDDSEDFFLGTAQLAQ